MSGKISGRAIREFGMVLLCLAGLIDTAALFFQETHGTAGKFCAAVAGDLGSNCEAVISSRYSEIAGVKLTILGMAYYLSMLWLSLWARAEGARGGGWAARLIITAISATGLTFSVYLTYLQASVLGAWCPFCVLSAVLTLTIFGLALWNVFSTSAESSPPENETRAVVEPSMWIGALALSCVFLASALMISLAIQGSPPAPTATASALDQWIKYVPRRNTPPGGAVYGYDTAPVAIQAFLDFTCSHCREFEKSVYPMIRENYIDRGAVKWVSKSLPHSDQGSPMFFAIASMCGRSERDSGLIDRALFEYPIPSPKTGFDALSDALARAGVGSPVIGRVAECMVKQGDDMKTHVIGEVQQAFSYGLKGPPAFVIDGIAFQGSMDYATMSGIIDRFIKDREGQ